jgi:hypothetical protein
MKRFHVHLAVENLEQSIGFYSSLFASPPTVQKSDYAKWMLEDPRVNFAISQRGRDVGLTHLGIQAEDEAEFAEVHARLKVLKQPVLSQSGARCCYAEGDKNWVTDPAGIDWETFVTYGAIDSFGEDTGTRAEQPAKAAPACCG